MSYEVCESSHAAIDLDLIIRYLVDTLKSPTAASRVLDEYENLVSTLEETPTAYPLVQDDLLAFAGYHWAPISSYMVFFTIDEEEKRVDLHRIVHGSRNWVRLLST